MQKVREFLLAVLFAGIVLAIVLVIARPILIPPGADDVTPIGWGWREFEYKDARYIQSPLGHMTMVRDDKASLDRFLELLKHAGKRATE